MEKLHDKRFPNEESSYRTSRNELLQAEIELRRSIESVARMRRELPRGGKLKEDYTFDELDQNGQPKQTKLSELFDEGKNNLIIYSMMFEPGAKLACPACTSIIDGLDGSAPHVRDKVNFVVITKAPIEQTRKWADGRGWRNVRLLSSFSNTYNHDYFAEDDTPRQIPALNVFEKTSDGIFHSYNTELAYAPSDAGQHPRHVDMIWPIWNLFDYTREGRGEWFPKFDYETA